MSKIKRIVLVSLLIAIAIIIYVYGQGSISRIISLLSGLGGIIGSAIIFFPEIKDWISGIPSKDEKQSKEIFDELVEEKAQRKNLQSEVESKDERISKKDEKLDYILESLDRDVLGTDYLVKKYRKPLNSILAIFSHQKPNSFIKNQIDDMGGKVWKGKVGIIPPQNVPDGNLKSEKLEKWFTDNFLQKGNEQYKVRLLPIDLKNAFVGKEINREDHTYPDYDDLEDIFDIRDIMSANEVYDLIKDEISFKEEIKENIGLLLVPIATPDQLDILLDSENQLELQDRLGDIRQITNTDTERIEQVLSDYVDNADELASELKSEAEDFREKYEF